MKLSTLQRRFSDALTNSANATTPSGFGSNQNTDERAARFAIYRNNVFKSLQEVLASVFPAVKKVVGEDFFALCCREFVGKAPPHTAALVNYGEDFPNFLAAFDAAKTLPYLPDLARLEFARHTAYFAADAKALGTSEFGAIDPEKLGCAKLVFHPSLSIISSHYALGSLLDYLWNETGETTGAFNIDRPEKLLVFRDGLDTKMLFLSQGNFSVFDALIKGHILTEALAAGMQSEKKFQAAQAVELLLSNNIITDLTWNDET